MRETDRDEVVERLLREALGLTREQEQTFWQEFCRRLQELAAGQRRATDDDQSSAG